MISTHVRKFIVIALAFAVAVTTFAAPAPAQSGAVNLGTIGAGIAGSPEFLDRFDGTIVTVIYETLLSRTPSAVEVHAWLDAIHHGTKFDTFVRAVLDSPEFRSHHYPPEYVVIALYVSFLGRYPSQAEVVAWLAYATR